MLLEHMPTGNVSLNKKIREQYAWFIKGIVAEKDTADLKKATECYEKALNVPVVFDKIAENRGNFQCKRDTYLCYISEFVMQSKPKEKKKKLFQDFIS